MEVGPGQRSRSGPLCKTSLLRSWRASRRRSGRCTDASRQVPSASLLTTTCGRIARLSAAVPKKQVTEDPVAVEAKRSQSRPPPPALTSIRGRGRLAQEGPDGQRRWKSDALASASAARRGSRSHSCLEDMLCKVRFLLRELLAHAGLAAVCRGGRDVAKSLKTSTHALAPTPACSRRTEMLPLPPIAMDLPKARWPPRCDSSLRRARHRSQTPGVLCHSDSGRPRPQSTIPSYCVTCVQAVLAGTDTVNMFADRLDIMNIAARRSRRRTERQTGPLAYQPGAYMPDKQAFHYATLLLDSACRADQLALESGSLSRAAQHGKFLHAAAIVPGVGTVAQISRSRSKHRCGNFAGRVTPCDLACVPTVSIHAMAMLLWFWLLEQPSHGEHKSAEDVPPIGSSSGVTLLCTWNWPVLGVETGAECISRLKQALLKES
ncbi:unnamed protein product [Symbiodinium microadriaticum]|nr:unnamed protein product [Symbiodinium microadriaticum]